MLDRIGKGILVVILTVGVVLGAYLGYGRYLIELQDRTVELCVDLGDVKKIAAFEKKPLGPILKEIKKRGIVSVGLFEETLPDANALGEVYYAKGSGILRLGNFTPVFRKSSIKADRTYLYIPADNVRKRIYNQLGWAIGKKNIRFLSKQVLEINEAEKEIRELGLGISDAQKKFLISQGFSIVPRVWNDPRYHPGNIGPKISALKAYDIIIFDGEDILGYPDALKPLAQALKKNRIKYGYIEIVKQDGDRLLRRLMGKDVVRVHSVPKRELKKLKKDEVVRRFVRAARERKARLIYMRPFLPPQVDTDPVAYNLDYFGKVKTALEKAGFVIGKAEPIHPLKVKGWQFLVLGLGVVVGTLFLLNHFFRIHILLMLVLVILSAGGIIFAGAEGFTIELQKGLALLTAIVFPTLAVISSFAKKDKPSFLPWNGTHVVLNILAETLIGVFLLIGLLADYRFMLGVETFRGVKLALLAPILLVAFYFILMQGRGGIKERILSFLNTEVKILSILLGLLALGALGIFVARSGNFVLPVPGIEKNIRNLLETILFIRPRTKEFLVGYPFIFLATVAFLRGKVKWLWILAALGAIAPISVMNTFSHIHTPLMISMIRTVNGLALGILIGGVVALIAGTFIRKEEDKT
ncbi:MAG: DUF5693 family protein [Candidatus Margulisiibacteriota bacterium]